MCSHFQKKENLKKKNRISIGFYMQKMIIIHLFIEENRLAYTHRETTILLTSFFHLLLDNEEERNIDVIFISRLDYEFLFLPYRGGVTTNLGR